LLLVYAPIKKVLKQAVFNVKMVFLRMC